MIISKVSDIDEERYTDDIVECIFLEELSCSLGVLAGYGLTTSVDVEKTVDNGTDTEEDSPPPMGAPPLDLWIARGQQRSIMKG